MLSYVFSKESVGVYIDGKLYTVHQGTHYNMILRGIQTGDLGLIRDAVLAKFRIRKQLEQYGSVEISGDEVTLDGVRVTGSVVDRILASRSREELVKPLACFLERLQRNPDLRARQGLFDWIEAGQLPITPDGYIVAYKLVAENYKDIYSGTFDNSPGQVVEIDREECDPNPEKTCSSGLHFCSAGYLPHYGSGRSSKVVIVKIDPADVVAFPRDYNLSKGRCCRYTVVHEVPRETAAEWFAEAGYVYEPLDNVAAAESQGFVFEQTGTGCWSWYHKVAGLSCHVYPTKVDAAIATHGVCTRNLAAERLEEAERLGFKLYEFEGRWWASHPQRGRTESFADQEDLVLHILHTDHFYGWN